MLSGGDAAFSVVRTSRSRFVGPRLPRRLLTLPARGLDDRTMRVIAADTEPLRLLIGYVGAIAGNPAAMSIGAAATVAALLHDLVALTPMCWRTQPPDPRPGLS